jgi:predicted component of type VI protein secretion system
VRPHLEVAKGRHSGTVIPIRRRFLIGGDGVCNLRSRSRKISSWHCALVCRDEKLLVRDLNSDTGTFVNDRPVKEQVELHDDDRLRVGSLRFIVRLLPGPAREKPVVDDVRPDALVSIPVPAGELVPPPRRPRRPI